jgi:hypothetical protein
LPYAFVGGSVVNLLLDYPELTPARPTDDVDVIVDMRSTRHSSIAVITTTMAVMIWRTS